VLTAPRGSHFVRVSSALTSVVRLCNCSIRCGARAGREARIARARASVALASAYAKFGSSLCGSRSEPEEPVGEAQVVLMARYVAVVAPAMGGRLLGISDIAARRRGRCQSRRFGSYGGHRSPPESGRAGAQDELTASMLLEAQQTQQHPSVLVAKGQRIATTGSVDQVSRYFQPGEDLSHSRDIIADLFWEQRRV
jgi:hypothetical protein